MNGLGLKDYISMRIRVPNIKEQTWPKQQVAEQWNLEEMGKKKNCWLVGRRWRVGFIMELVKSKPKLGLLEKIRVQLNADQGTGCLTFWWNI